MIICVAGTPGAGKSYDIVKKILDNIRLGRTVYTNVDGFDDPEVRHYQQLYMGLDDWDFQSHCIFLNKEKAQVFWRHCKPGSLIVIDEIHRFFNSRDWMKPENREFVDWASTHRHEGYDLIMITQALEKVDKQARSLVEWTYFYRKVNFFGSLIKNKFQMFSYIGDDDRGKAFANKIKTYDPKIFKCYKSYVTHDVKEQGFMSHVNVLKHPVFFILPIVLVFMFYMIFFKSSLGSGDFLGAKKAEKNRVSILASRGKSLTVGKKASDVVNIVEYKNLGLKEKKASVSIVKDLPGVPVPVPEKCVKSSEILTDSEKIEVFNCGNMRVVKKDGVEVYRKEQRKDRMERISVGGLAKNVL